MMNICSETFRASECLLLYLVSKQFPGNQQQVQHWDAPVTGVCIRPGAPEQD